MQRSTSSLMLAHFVLVALVGACSSTPERVPVPCSECDPGKNHPDDPCGPGGLGKCQSSDDAGLTLVCSHPCDEKEPASTDADCGNDFACK